MLRFPNPGSNIKSFITIYQELYELLKEQEYFTLDDFSTALIMKNLATSCGYVGEEALRRSTRDDRTRDPLYNQSKMYSELYKILGWLHPRKESKLQFTFTYLGVHVVAAKKDPWELFRRSVLGIAYPTPNIDVKSKQKVRPFSAIIKSMSKLEGFMSRDEMILGPLSLENDRDDTEFDRMIKSIKSTRGGHSILIEKLKNLSLSLKIDQNTMWNYTRFPLGVLKWAGWAKDVRKRVYGRSTVFYELTEQGAMIATGLTNSFDLRGEDIKKLDKSTQKAVILISFYNMLNESGFDVSEVFNDQNKDFKTVEQLYGEPTNILFSPFQEIDPDYVQSLFPKIAGSAIVDIQEKRLFSKTTDETQNKIFKSNVQLKYGSKESARFESDILSLFEKLYKKEKNIDAVVEVIKEGFKEANKDVFYPFVSQLFRILGYDSEVSRAGMNYQRWDAIIIDDKKSIPIEIKSPGEEQFISVKAVRQALENKIILLAREQYPTTKEATSLVVGYHIPNDRSEVNGLISDIHKAFNVVIGVIDLRSLLLLVGKMLLEGKVHNKDDLAKLQGIIDVTDVQTENTKA